MFPISIIGNQYSPFSSLAPFTYIAFPGYRTFKNFQRLSLAVRSLIICLFNFLYSTLLLSSIYNIGVSATLIRGNFISCLLLVVHIFNSIYFYILSFFNIAYKLSRLLLTTNCYNKMGIGK